MEEAALGFQNLFRSGPAERGEIGCDHAGFGGMARLKWFHHRAEVLAQAGSVAGGHSEGPRGVHHVQSFELGAGGGSAENSASAGRVKSIFIVSRRDRLCDLALYFDSTVVGDQ